MFSKIKSTLKNEPLKTNKKNKKENTIFFLIILYYTILHKQNTYIYTNEYIKRGQMF